MWCQRCYLYIVFFPIFFFLLVWHLKFRSNSLFTIAHLPRNCLNLCVSALCKNSTQPRFHQQSHWTNAEPNSQPINAIESNLYRIVCVKRDVMWCSVMILFSFDDAHECLKDEIFSICIFLRNSICICS